MIFKSATRSSKLALTGFLFCVPALIFFIGFNLYPILYSLFISFFDYRLSVDMKYIGLGNFINVLTDPVFWRSFQATVIYVGGTVIPIWILSLLTALLLTQSLRGRGVYRTLFFIPVLMTLAVTSVIWKFMFHPYGIFNEIIGSVFPADQLNWLTNKNLAPLAMIIMSVWKGVPYYALLFITGLENIPRSYYEAAKIDGANPLQRFNAITFPLLKPTLLFVIVVSVIIGLRVFIPQLILTNGGPGDSTRVLTLMIYETAFRFRRMGLASAMSIVLFLLIALFSVLQFKLFREKQ